jgi:integrase/recombinase XerD
MSNAEDRYRAYLQAEKRSEGTISKYVRESLHHLLEWYGKPPETLTKKDLQAYKEKVAEKYSENSMVVEISAINGFLENILERKDLRMKAPKRVENHRTPLTESEVKKILAVAEKKSPRDHAVLCLLYFGALRAGEVTQLWVSDLDLERRKVKVRAGKGKDYSTVNLTEYAVDALKGYLDNNRPKIVVVEEEAAKHLFLTVNGNPLRRKDVWKMVKVLAFEAGIAKDVFPHIFRHSAITHMAEKGIQVYDIQAQSRHKSMDMVQKYIHQSEESVRTAYDKAFSGEKAEAFKEPATPAKPVPPTPRAEDESALRDLAVLLGKLSEENRRKLSSMINHFDNRVELHGG